MTKLQKNIRLFSAVFTALVVSLSVRGAYFATLPKGVRTLVFHHLFTDQISGRFDMNGATSSLGVAADINADSLYGIDTSIDNYLDDLKTSDPDKYDAFSLGKYEFNACAQVHVNALGVGYGITDRLTGYVFTPHYSASVDLEVKKVKVENYDELLHDMGIEASNIPTIDNRMIQSVIVNYYGYKPLGDWIAKDFGDTEVGFMYKPIYGKQWGLLVTPGFVIPTGRDDDPDLLQDFAFGDGQWDIFLELGGGFEWKHIAFDLWGRYTYQLPTTKYIRLPESADVPVTKRKGNARIKLGNRVLANIQGNIILNSIFTLSVLHSIEYKQKDDYQSAYPVADSYWENGTESLAQMYKLTLETTTVKLFKRQIFAVPLSLYISYQKTYAGKNTPYYTRFDFEFRLFF